MNVILFQTDQHRFDALGCYGNTLCQTPTLDRLAAQGIKFNNAFTCTAICGPARASLMTGKFPIQHNIVVNPESGLSCGKDFPDKENALGEILSKNDVLAVHLGKWHIGTNLSPADCGFSGPFIKGYGDPISHPDYKEYLKKRGLKPCVTKNTVRTRFEHGAKGHVLGGLLDGSSKACIPYYLAERAIEALEHVKKEGKPFFLHVDFWGPHLPYLLPEPYFSMYDPAKIEPWKTWDDTLTDKPRILLDYKRYWGVQDFTWQDWAPIVALYYGYVTLIDEQIGRIVQACRDLGLLDMTALYYTTDHGGMVGSRGLCDKGPFMYDECYRLPLLAWQNGSFEKGKTINDFIYHFDLMPTILENFGIELPKDIAATSFFNVLKGGKPKRSDKVVFGEFHGHQAPFEQRMVRGIQSKYIYNCTDTDEYYDLQSDPYEKTNLINDSRYYESVREYRIILLKWMEQMGDPLLRFYRDTNSLK
jgi:arylsulfatase A-like enzyme